MVEGVWEKFGAFVHQQIVWAKDRGILTRSYYLWQHEPCFFGWLKGHKPPRVSDDYPSTVWTIPTVKVGEKTDHPTSKPIEVFAHPDAPARRGRARLCYEPFSGSGSQIIAGETTGRRVFAIEISPVVRRRRGQALADGDRQAGGAGGRADEASTSWPPSGLRVRHERHRRAASPAVSCVSGGGSVGEAVHPLAAVRLLRGDGRGRASSSGRRRRRRGRYAQASRSLP